MKHLNIREQIEMTKNSIRNYAHTVADNGISTVAEYNSTSDKIIEIAPALKNIKNFYGENLKVKESANSITLEVLLSASDNVIEDDFNKMDLEKMFEDFSIERKMEELKQLKNNNHSNNENSYSSENQEEDSKPKYSEEDLNKSKEQLLDLLEAYATSLFDDDKKDDTYKKHVRSAFDKNADILTRTIAKADEANVDNDEISELVKKEFVAIINNGLQIINKKINEFIKSETEKDNSSNNQQEEDNNQNTPLIDGDNFEIINKLEVPMSPLQFSKKDECKKYIHLKLEKYNQLKDSVQLTDFKKSELKKLNLKKINIDGNTTLESIFKEINDYANDGKNTVAQLKAMCINLSKVENILFLS